MGGIKLLEKGNTDAVPSIDICLKIWNCGIKIHTQYTWRRIKGKAQCVIETPPDSQMMDIMHRGFRKFFTHPEIDDHLIPAPNIKEMLDFLMLIQNTIILLNTYRN